MAELTRDGAATGTGGLVSATIRENVVIHGEPINSIYSDSGEPEMDSPRGFPDPCLCRGWVIDDSLNTLSYSHL